MDIKCKHPDCAGFVYYTPGDTDLVAFTIALKDDVLKDLDWKQFETSVKHIVKTDTNKFTTTKGIYLTCDKYPSHTYRYSIPA